MRPLFLAAAVVLAAAPGAAAQKQDVPEAKPVGKPVDCLQLRSIRGHKVRSDRIIDFYTTGKKVYRNELPVRCPSLKFEERFMHKTALSQLCSTDNITVLESGGGIIPGATCGLGKFQQVTLAAGAR